jgi:ABC-type transport system substrate-binding protein
MLSFAKIKGPVHGHGRYGATHGAVDQAPAAMAQLGTTVGRLFVDYKSEQYIKVTRNLEYWKPGRPYLDGIEYIIILRVTAGG